jgi:hypothetical protein
MFLGMALSTSPADGDAQPVSSGLRPNTDKCVVESVNMRFPNRHLRTPEGFLDSDALFQMFATFNHELRCLRNPELATG